PVLSPTDILTQMTQQAPRSTLYPYTTLFRSQVQIGKQQVFSPAAAAPRLQHFRQKGPGEKQKDRESDGQGAAAEGGGQHQGEGGHHDHFHSIQAVNRSQVLQGGQGLPGFRCPSEKDGAEQQGGDQQHRHCEQKERDDGRKFGQQDLRPADGANEQQFHRSPAKLAGDDIPRDHQGKQLNDKQQVGCNRRRIPTGPREHRPRGSSAVRVPAGRRPGSTVPA